jgi:nicotinic acid mononucleotide adenylyltransferase
MAREYWGRDITLALSHEHHFKNNLLNYNLRYKLIKKCIDIDIIESDKYMINTLEKYDIQSIIIGSDILHELHKWHRYKDLLKYHYSIVLRKGYDLINLPRYDIIGSINENISSTNIRGGDISYIPDEILADWITLIKE